MHCDALDLYCSSAVPIGYDDIISLSTGSFSSKRHLANVTSMYSVPQHVSPYNREALYRDADGVDGPRNGKKVSNSQTCCLAQLCLAAA